MTAILFHILFCILSHCTFWNIKYFCCFSTRPSASLNFVHSFLKINYGIISFNSASKLSLVPTNNFFWNQTSGIYILSTVRLHNAPMKISIFWKYHWTQSPKLKNNCTIGFSTKFYVNIILPFFCTPDKFFSSFNIFRVFEKSHIFDNTVRKFWMTQILTKMNHSPLDG